MATVITSEEFKEKVLNNPKPVVVDFFATWCGPCKRLAPLLEELAEETTDFEIYKIDVDDSGDIAEQFNIMSVPTLMIFKNGAQTGKLVGLHSKKDIIDAVNS